MWPFRPKPAPKPALPKLVYKSADAFFEMQCKFGYTDINERQAVVAIVLDAKMDIGTDVAVKIQPNGCQLATIKVASSDGGFKTFAETVSSKGDRLKPGDLVMWMPMAHMKELADAVGNHRQGWIGLIVAKIAPEGDPNTNQMTVICRYE